MRLSGRTMVLGIFGDPIAHSRSPEMQNAALAAAGIDAVYVPFHVVPGQLGCAAAALRGLGIRGVNVTIPHKEAILAHLDMVDPEAQLIGAVNTVVNRQGRLVGYNTDGLGLLRSLEEDLQFSPAGKRILLLGAGGACRAALVALARGGAAWIGIANRHQERAAGLVKEFTPALAGTYLAHYPLLPEHLTAIVGNVDLLVNTSAVGLHGESFPPELFAALLPRACIYDMVYRDGGTPLLKMARQKGMRCAGGLGMLAGQGEEAFFLWTGQQPPTGVMRSRLLENSVAI